MSTDADLATRLLRDAEYDHAEFSRPLLIEAAKALMAKPAHDPDLRALSYDDLTLIQQALAREAREKAVATLRREGTGRRARRRSLEASHPYDRLSDLIGDVLDRREADHG